MRRRGLLKGAAALTLAGGTATPLFAAGRSDLRIVSDGRLPGGRALARLARGRGHAVADPYGEIVALFLGDAQGWLADRAPVLGLTSYTDMMLMRDLARMHGRSMRYAAPRGLGSAALVDRLRADEPRDLLAFVQSAAEPADGRSRTFLWLV